MENHLVKVYYTVKKVSAINIEPLLDEKKHQLEASDYKGLEQPIHIEFYLNQYIGLEQPFIYGIDALAAKGIALTREKFNTYRKKGKRS